jgi:hypothetical protein
LPRQDDVKKRRGDFSFEISPLAFRFFEDPVRDQITTTRHFRIIRDLRAEPAVSRTFPSLPSLQELSRSIHQQPVS